MALISWWTLRIIIILILLPFATHFLSTEWFHRKARRATTGKTPPTLPYYIPGLYHVFNILRDGPPVFFAEAIKEHGAFAPFIVKAGPLKFMIVRSAEHVRKIFLSVKDMTVTDFHAQLFEKVFASPPSAVQIYKDIGKNTNAHSDAVHRAHLNLPKQYLQGMGLVPTAEVYIKTLRRSMGNKMFQEGSWTEIEDMWSFFQNEITKATIETIFGYELLRMYPKVVPDFWKFEDSFDQFFRGLPRFTMPTAYATRDRLLGKLGEWLEKVHPGNESARVGEEDEEWDERLGSKLAQARDQVYARNGMDVQARASEVLSLIQGSNANTMPSTFWFLFETLRSPPLHSHLRTLITPLFNPQTGTYDIAALTSLPIIQSMHAEISRLRMATATLRQNQTPNFRLDDQWLVPKDTQIMILPKDLALNTELWAKARPKTVERPLTEFWPGRFLVSDRRPKDQTSVNPRTTLNSKMKEKEVLGDLDGRFSMEGISYLHCTFGGGQHLCPGRYLARAIQAATLAVMVCEFEVMFCDGEEAEGSIPMAGEPLIGMVKPLENVRVRLRKRVVGKGGKGA